MSAPDQRLNISLLRSGRTERSRVVYKHLVATGLGVRSSVFGLTSPVFALRPFAPTASGFAPPLHKCVVISELQSAYS
jgi:hypothetical protein